MQSAAPSSERATSLDSLNPSASPPNDQLVNDILQEINTENTAGSASNVINHQIDPHSQPAMPPATQDESEQLEKNVRELSAAQDAAQLDDQILQQQQQQQLLQQQQELQQQQLQQQQHNHLIASGHQGSASHGIDIISLLKTTLLFMIVYILFTLPDVQKMFLKVSAFASSNGGLNIAGTVVCALVAAILFSGVQLYV